MADVVKPANATATAVGADVAPRRPGILLLHGLTGMPSEMRPLERHLRAGGYAVSVPLLPGHGGTHRELLATTWSDWLAGARAACDELSARCDTVVVAGLSMGALLAALLAVGDERVAGIVLLSPTLQYDGASIPWTRRLLPLANVVPGADRFFYWTEKPPYGLRDERLQRLVTRAVEAARRGEHTEYGLFRTYVGSVRELNRMVRVVRRRAGAVRCPALVVHSREDTITSGANAEEMHALLGSADKSICWVTGCDHVLTIDLQKDAVARAVSDFVAGLSGVARRRA